MKVAVIDYGAGNVKSVSIALDRLGVANVLTDDPQQIRSASHVIFPGQGTAGMAMQKLKSKELDRLLPTLKQPVLGICLGLQLLFEHTDEGFVAGLGIIKGQVKRFEGALKIPQMGWNQLTSLNGPLFEGIASGTYMYLVHSYYAPIVPETTGVAFYGLDYSVAVQKDNFYGVQFHPEKSGKGGRCLLQNFLKLR